MTISYHTLPVHPWLNRIRVAFVPGPMTALLKEVVSNLLDRFRRLGHVVQQEPGEDTDVILTTAPFGEPLDWRKALLFTGRRRFRLRHTPTVFTLVHTRPAPFQALLDRFRVLLEKETPEAKDFSFPGLAPEAYKVLFEQGRRGGPIMALERLVQAQSKSIRVILIVGEKEPLTAYHFDLVGAHPQSPADPPDLFYDDIVLRIVTTMSTQEVAEHEVVDDPIPADLWQSLTTPAAMCEASRQLGRRHFFTDSLPV